MELTVLPDCRQALRAAVVGGIYGNELQMNCSGPLEMVFVYAQSIFM